MGILNYTTAELNAILGHTVYGNNIQWNDANYNLSLGSVTGTASIGVDVFFYTHGTNNPSADLHIYRNTNPTAIYASRVGIFSTGLTTCGAANQVYGFDPTSTYYKPDVRISKNPGDDISINIGDRFAWGVDATAEIGNNTGSNWYLSRFDDTGTLIDKPLKVDRSTGQVVARGVPFALVSGGAPFIVAGAGTVGNNGVFTQTTPLFSSAAGLGSWVWFNTGALYTSSPMGWYWGVWSSTTVCTVYANTYVSGRPINPATPTPITATGPGAYAGPPANMLITSLVMPVAGSDLTPYSNLTLKGFAIGATAAAKTYRVEFGGSSVGNISFSNTQAEVSQSLQMQGNLSSSAILVASGAVNNFTNSRAAGFDLTFTFTTPAASPNEWMMFSGYNSIMVGQ